MQLTTSAYHHRLHYHHYHHSIHIPSPSVTRRIIFPSLSSLLRKRCILSTLGPDMNRIKFPQLDYQSQGIDYGFVRSKEAAPEIAHMTVGEVNTRVTELAELHEQDTQDLYALLEDAQDREATMMVEEEPEALARLRASTPDTDYSAVVLSHRHSIRRYNSARDEPTCSRRAELCGNWLRDGRGGCNRPGSERLRISRSPERLLSGKRPTVPLVLSGFSVVVSC
ncbi:hypothetical protein Tco_1319410 [Tanacetum coccineum]